MTSPQFDGIKPKDPGELSNDARIAMTDFVFIVFEGEKRRKDNHLKFMEYLIDTDYNGPINTLSENIIDMMRYHNFDTAYTLLTMKLGRLGMDRRETTAVMLGSLMPFISGDASLPGRFGITAEDVDGILASLGEGREWRNHGKDNGSK